MRGGGVAGMITVRDLSRAVRGTCLWCQGQCWTLVRHCASESCPLHAVRFLDRQEDAPCLIMAVEAFCRACAGSEEEVLGCTAHSAMGSQGACPLHPFRCASVRPAISAQQVRSLPGLVPAESAVSMPSRPKGAPERAGSSGEDFEERRTVFGKDASWIPEVVDV